MRAWIGTLEAELCTLRLARKVWPDAPDFKLQTLRFLLELDAGQGHRAMGDVRATVDLLRKASEEFGMGVLDLAQQCPPRQRVQS